MYNAFGPSHTHLITLMTLVPVCFCLFVLQQVLLCAPQTGHKLIELSSALTSASQVARARFSSLASNFFAVLKTFA